MATYIRKFDTEVEYAVYCRLGKMTPKDQWTRGGGHIPPEDEFVYPHVAYCVDHDVAGLGNVQPAGPEFNPWAQKIGSYTHSNSRYGYATVTYESSANTVNFINMSAATRDKNVWCFVSRKNPDVIYDAMRASDLNDHIKIPLNVPLIGNGDPNHTLKADKYFMLFDTYKASSWQNAFSACAALKKFSMHYCNSATRYGVPEATSFASMFANCTKLKTVEFTRCGKEKVEFENGKRINTVENKAAISMIGGSMSGMFGGCSAIEKIDMRGIDLSRWTSAYGDMSYLNMFINCAQGIAGLNFFKLKNQKRKPESESVLEPVIYLPKDSPSNEFERNVNVTGSGKPTSLTQLDSIFRGIYVNTHIYIANHEGYNILGRAAYDASADLQYYSCYECPRWHDDIYNKNTFKFGVQRSSGGYYIRVYYDLLLNNDIINNDFRSFKNNTSCDYLRYRLTTSAADNYIFYAPWDWDNLSRNYMMESFYPKKPFFGIWVTDNTAVANTGRPGARNTVDFVAKTLNMANAVREHQPCMLQPDSHPYPSVDHKDVVTFLW